MWSNWASKKLIILSNWFDINVFEFVKYIYFSENENKNETTSDLPKPYFVITGATGSFIQDTVEENQALKVQVDQNQGVADDDITEIFEVLKEHGNDITNLRIQQGYTSGKLQLGHSCVIP